MGASVPGASAAGSKFLHGGVDTANIASMRVLILGASGRIGRAALAATLERGLDVVALVRQDPGPPKDRRVQHIIGDVRDSAAIQSAVDGIDAVIAALGPRSNTPDEEAALERGMRALVEAMERRGVTRLVTLSGAGVDVPGDRKPFIDRIMSGIVRVAARHVVGAKQREFDVMAASLLAWTAVRPPLVNDGPARGYRLDLRLQPGARVTRADVGQALVDQLEDVTYIRAAPFVLPARPE